MWPRIGSTALVALVSLSGCGFLDEPARPSADAPLVSASVAAPPAGPQVLVTTSLTDDESDLPFAPFHADLEVAVHPEVAGWPQLGPHWPADCGHGAEETMRYLAVDLELVDRSEQQIALAAGVSLTSAPGAGTDAAAVGVFVESGDPDTRYCEGGERTPAVDHLLVLGAPGEPVTVTVFLVAGAEAPTDALTGLTLAVTELRNRSYGPSRDTAWLVDGAPVHACGEEPGGLCVDIG
ncbi:hypothetical protein [uncultured Modestobacter sp.]|uniref:hypothetical protein n=1 Tax=uncultured Modestobacter sp. TaxID=380048 RepID=UPI002623364B|nr:hypothetical protein [uncultured Modestobacter sp.]